MSLSGLTIPHKYVIIISLLSVHKYMYMSCTMCSTALCMHEYPYIQVHVHVSCVLDIQATAHYNYALTLFIVYSCMAGFVLAA